MTPEERAEAIFGSFDGTVSVIGLVFGLLAHGSPVAAIAVAGVAAATSATVSMGSGEYEKDDAPWRKRAHRAGAMALATLIGSLVPVWPYFAFTRMPATLAAGAGSLVVALWIGRQKSKAESHPHSGARCYATSVAFLVGAAALSVGIVAAIPASAGG